MGAVAEIRVVKINLSPFLVPFFTGRAVTKHPEYFGFSTTQELRKIYRTDSQINELAGKAINEILQSGVKSNGAGGRYPGGWITYTLPDGRAASWGGDGKFIGFRGVQK